MSVEESAETQRLTEEQAGSEPAMEEPPKPAMLRQHSRSNSSLSGNKSPLSRTASSSGIGSPLMARTNSSRGLRFQDSAGGTFGTAPHPTFMGELEAVCPVGSYEKDIDPMTSPLQRKDSFSFKTERRSSVVDELVKAVAENPGPGQYDAPFSSFRTNSFNKKTLESLKQAASSSPKRPPVQRSGSSSGEVFSRLYSTPTKSSSQTEDKPREFSEAVESDFEKIKRSNSGRWVGGGRRSSAAEETRIALLNKTFGET